MPISIELLLKNMGLIQSAKQSSEAVGEVADSLDEVGEAGTDATSVAKAALEDLRRANMDHARVTNQTWGEMTEAEQDEFRKRYDNAESLQQAVGDLDRRRAEAAKRVNEDYTAEYQRTFGKLEDTAEDASRSVADSTERGFERAGDAAKSASDDITDSVGGAFRDLDGTAEGAVTSVADGLAGLAATASGVGGLIGAAAGTAGTLMVKEYFKAAEESEKRIDDMYQAFLDSGQTYYTEAQRLDVIKAFLDDDNALARAQRVADTLGIPLADAVNALIEKNAINNTLLQEAVRLRDEEFKNVDDLSTSEQSRLSALETTISFLQTINDEQDASVSKVQLFNQVVAAAPGGFNDITDAAADASSELDGMASPRTARVVLEVDTDAAERAIDRVRARASRDMTTEFYVTQNGRLIR